MLERLEALKERGQWRDAGLGVAQAVGGSAGVTEVDARSNDYLGLAIRSVSRETMGAGVLRAGAGASRLISGTTAEHLELERALADWLRVETTLVFSSGYAANVGVVSALAGPGDVVFSDALNHASLIDGCRLGRGRVVVTPHLDLRELERGLAQTQEATARWVVTESYFGMDGDVPELRELRELCDAHEAGLVVDEAHALGVFGPEGRGLCAGAGVRPDVLVGGMGKGLGVQGGFVACSSVYREWLWNRARSFVFSTAVSPVVCRIAVEQVGRLRAANAARRRLEELGARLERVLESGGIRLPPARRGPLFPIIFGGEAETLRAANELLARGVAVHAIRPPTVPPGGSRLRVTLRADMTDAEVERLGAMLVEVWRSSGAGQGMLIARSSAAPPAHHGVVAERARGSTELAGRGTAGALTLPGAGGRRAERAPGAVGAVAKRWLVLGTGTGVGKSFVAEALARAIAARGHPVGGLKPIETGLGAALEPAGAADARRLERASFHVKHPAAHPLFGYSDPVTPSLAARREGRAVCIERILPWLDEVRSDAGLPAPALVIETAGGAFSPLSDDRNNLDLAAALEPAEWILVAPDRLGALHEVLATLRAMELMRRPPDWIVLSAVEQPDASSGSNATELRRHGVAPHIISLQRDDPTPLDTIVAPHFPHPTETA